MQIWLDFLYFESLDQEMCRAKTKHETLEYVNTSVRFNFVKIQFILFYNLILIPLFIKIFIIWYASPLI